MAMKEVTITGEHSEEIKQRWAAFRVSIMTSLFDLPLAARQKDHMIHQEQLDANPGKTAGDLKFEVAEYWASSVRDDLFLQYSDSYLKENEELLNRRLKLESSLDAANIDSASLFQASQLTEEQLVASADTAIALGDVDSALVALETCRSKEFEVGVDKISEIIPGDVPAILAEIASLQELPVLDLDKVKADFELAPAAPSKYEIMSARPSALDESSLIQSYMG